MTEASDLKRVKLGERVKPSEPVEVAAPAAGTRIEVLWTLGGEDDEEELSVRVWWAATLAEGDVVFYDDLAHYEVASERSPVKFVAGSRLVTVADQDSEEEDRDIREWRLEVSAAGDAALGSKFPTVDWTRVNSIDCRKVPRPLAQCDWGTWEDERLDSRSTRPGSYFYSAAPPNIVELGAFKDVGEREALVRGSCAAAAHRSRPSTSAG